MLIYIISNILLEMRLKWVTLYISHFVWVQEYLQDKYLEEKMLGQCFYEFVI